LRREAQAFGARDTSCDPSAVTVVTWLIGRERDAMVVDACGQRLVYVCGFEPCLLVSRMALGKAAPPSADRP
jgi:hypothetical protein